MDGEWGPTESPEEIQTDHLEENLQIKTNFLFVSSIKQVGLLLKFIVLI